ncbi:oxysterol-binding protein-related protein 4B isoform X1 [Spinacia oleracea]|uniref:Oxysterol-binding protein-related protein 4B isoform X1 n=2 Tax=Spinacia oleracea TaxID=3562 RepID=A0ABM3RB98_SPIOL|nr:oxysterol-binding protein-related protein 4B-like isoform X1 [Spinacia oleracea]
MGHPSERVLQLLPHVRDLEIENKKYVILTSPLSLEGTSDTDYKAPNILQLIFSLFKNVRPGADLTRFQLPPLFNMPKSQLQCYGELVYCVNKDMLSKCAKGENAIDRMIAVIAWNLSTVRTPTFGVAPYNPVLGETHHASRGTLNILLEQVSHHPPITAMHATDETSNIELVWCQQAIPKFHGTYIDGVINGKRRLNLLQKGESYVMNSPIMQFRLLPKPGASWVGNVKIKCQETDLEAQLSFKSDSFLGFKGGNGAIKGKIVESSSMKKLFEIHGHWDRIVYIKDTTDGETKVLYTPKEVISALPTPTLRDPVEGVWQSESAAVWAEVSKGIINKEWDKAREAKRAVEERERELHKQRKSIGEIWVPKHFDLCRYTPENGWDCTPKQKTVSPAPIILPI